MVARNKAWVLCKSTTSLCVLKIEFTLDFVLNTRESGTSCSALYPELMPGSRPCPGHLGTAVFREFFSKSLCVTLGCVVPPTET